MSDLNITLIQTSLVWEDKMANTQILQDKILGIADTTHIVVLPEMFSTGFSMEPEKLAEQMDGSTVFWMQKIAQQKKIILTGSLIIEEEGKYYNRLLWVLPDGKIHHYDKRHLFGYAGEDQHYTAGDKRIVVSVNGWRILLQVCYDLRFPVWARQEQSKDTVYEYDIILYVANWPQKRSVPWKSLLQARAIENMSYVVGVNRVGEDGNGFYHSGDSRIIDPLGTILFEKADDEIIHTHIFKNEDLEKVRNRFPFAKDADKFKLKL